MTLHLEALPSVRETVIAVGTSVRKPLPVLQAYLGCLDWQWLPPRTRLLPLFVADYEQKDTEAEAYLREWTAERGGTVLAGGPQAVGDFADTGGPTHQ